MKQKLLIAGGDLRQLSAAKTLAALHEVALMGFDRFAPSLPDEIVPVWEISALPWQPEVLVLPMPVSTDGVHVQMPHGSGAFPLRALLQEMPKGASVFGGLMKDAEIAAMEEAGLVPVDYARDEAFAVRNAVPTAEGAIAMALSQLPVTLHGLEVLILGAGRISRALYPRLLAFGAKVTVAARRFPDLARSNGGSGKPAFQQLGGGLLFFCRCVIIDVL